MLAPDLAPGVVTPLDWYIFDVAAAARYQDLLRAATDDAADDPPPRRSGPPATPRRAAVALRDHDDGTLIIRGDERPPRR